MRSTAFFKLYKICILLHRCNLKIFAKKNRFEKTAIFVKFQQKICKWFFSLRKDDLRHAVGPGSQGAGCSSVSEKAILFVGILRLSGHRGVLSGAAVGRPPRLGSLARSRSVRHRAAALPPGSPDPACSLPSLSKSSAQRAEFRAPSALISTWNWQRRAATASPSVASSRRQCAGGGRKRAAKHGWLAARHFQKASPQLSLIHI